MNFLVKNEDELPIIPSVIERLYADFETSSHDDKLTSLNPWHNCHVIGLAVTWDNNCDTYFIIDSVLRKSWWAWELLNNSYMWVNHNIKYDAHVYENNYWPIPKHLILHDTLTLAKLIDSDRKFKGGYGLAVLSKAWLGEDISEYENKLKASLNGSKDYGKLPLDILAPYACMDVITNRKLDHYIIQRLPKPCYKIKDIEKQTTKTLFDIENNGFHINIKDIAHTALRVKTRLMEVIDEFQKTYEQPIEPHIPGDLEQVLCGVYNLPPLKKTPKGKVCFDKKTLKKYLGLPESPRYFIETCLEYRELNTFLNGFIKPALRFQKDGIVHAIYNQSVSTGRMSAREPNIQAMSGLAKKLIIPREGKVFICVDYSQIEFRLIAHVAYDLPTIEAYNNDPYMDFHQFVADISNLDRYSAKTLNFATAYGMGEKATREQLATNINIQKIIKARGGDYQFELINYVKELRTTYFEKFATFRHASKQAQYFTVKAGYIETLYGRRINLMDYEHGINGAHKAFNAKIQGTAADLFKECVNKLHKEVPEINIIALVHDEPLMEVSIEDNTHELHCRIADILEAPSIELSLPIKIELGCSEDNWFLAKQNAKFVERNLINV